MNSFYHFLSASVGQYEIDERVHPKFLSDKQNNSDDYEKYNPYRFHIFILFSYFLG